MCLTQFRRHRLEARRCYAARWIAVADEIQKPWSYEITPSSESRPKVGSGFRCSCYRQDNFRFIHVARTQTVLRLHRCIFTTADLHYGSSTPHVHARAPRRGEPRSLPPGLHVDHLQQYDSVTSAVRVHPKAARHVRNAVGTHALKPWHHRAALRPAR